MAKKKAVLVTGVAGYWGGRVAAQLAADPHLRVISLDAQPPAQEINGLDFIQADVRNPLLADLLASENVHTVCHLAFVESARLSESLFDLNVMGTLKVLGACAAKRASVQNIVLKSSTAVYGALPGNSAFLTEDTRLNGSRRYGYTRDLVEIEAICSGFRRQSPQIRLTVLRFANIVGPDCDTPMTRFLRTPTAPVLWGFDPLMQVIHQDDVVSALVHATGARLLAGAGLPAGAEHDVSGVFNVAAEGPLPLSKLAALAGKLAVPVLHLLAYWTVPLGSDQLAPIEWDYLRYPWVGDLARMRSELGFTPRYTAAETLREFAAQQRLRRYRPDDTRAALARDEERLRRTLERRRERADASVMQTSSSQDEPVDATSGEEQPSHA